MLYPRESETREVKDLSGIWHFAVDKNDEGFTREWFKKPLRNPITMPVPASYNDLAQDPSVRDHIGEVWYERDFFVPRAWENNKIMVRMGSVTHYGVVWVNGIEVARHKGGYLPFEADVSEIVKYGKSNRITIAANNVLTWKTLPVGEVITYKGDRNHPENYKTQEYFHDFFNYSGIHRPVLLVALPKVHIDDITVDTDIRKTAGIVTYEIHSSGKAASVKVRLLNEGTHEVAAAQGTRGVLTVSKAAFWEPLKPYLYTLEASVLDKEGTVVDIYRLPVGIRTVKVQGKKFLINGKPFYFKGFGKHEDADLRGKGLDHVVNTKDLSLLKWIGANSFRTSHYPYSEEIMEMADREGIVIIDETPAVGMNRWTNDNKVFVEGKIDSGTLAHHIDVLRELHARDKNHPSVVMWSVANEAATFEKGSVPYFKAVIKEMKKLDSTRPVTIVESSGFDLTGASQFADVVCVNRYYSWYSDPGKLDLIEFQIKKELTNWYKRFGKPVIVSEYGADAVAGIHMDPPEMFSEEYQARFLEHFNNAFDQLDFVVGEHVWAFADFGTKQELRRVVGNRKGVFTRQRQPKMAAFSLRKRWTGKE